MRPFVSLLALLFLVAGCSESRLPAVADTRLMSAVSDMDRLVGQWNGPEGTFLQLAGVSGRYVITIRNLDGARTFPARGGDGVIHFERDGKVESIRRTDGAGTGMKWLREKRNCIVIQPGEGYCQGE